MSPAEKQARQMIADKKADEAAEKAYRKSLRMTEEAPEDKRAPVRGQKSYAKGGVTRGDGCVKKGHTKGRMV